MLKCKISIWERMFDLPLMYECYADEEILESQKEAYTMLEDSPEEVAEALKQVKKYVEQTADICLEENEIEDIFEYVMPTSIFVPHDEKHRTAAIMCDYKFDIEHGIAVVFENGQFKEVGSEDIVL